MALKIQIGGNNDFYLGEDKTVKIEVLDGDPTNNDAVTYPNAGKGFPVDITSWGAGGLQFDLKKPVNASVSVTGFPRDVIIDGAYTVPTAGMTVAAARAANAQRGKVIFTDAETALLQAITDPAKSYQCSFKRVVNDGETIIAEGPLVLQRAAQINP